MTATLPKTPAQLDLEQAGAFMVDPPWPPKGATCWDCALSREVAMLDGSTALACDAGDWLAQVLPGSAACESWEAA